MSELYLNSSAPEHEELSGASEEEVFVFPLSFAQQRLWFIHQLDPSNAAYNMPFPLRLMGQLDVPALEATLNEIVRRHEALRTTFDVLEEEPIQVIASTQRLELALTDLSALPTEKRETEARRLAAEDVLRPFDFTRGPLLRASLLRLAEQEHVLSLTMPHIISDGWSMGVLVREVAALYEAFSNGQASPLPELPVQYADYAVWQREYLQGETLERELAYWRKQLAGAAQVLELPTDHPRPLVQKFNGAHELLNLSSGLSDALKQLSQREGATVFMTLLAAFQTLLYRYTGQEDILVGTPVANRHQTDAEQLIGLFTNTLVLRTVLDGAWSFRQLLARVRETCLGALAHQDVPFERLVEELRPERTRSHSPLFQVMFTSQNTPEEEVTLPGLRIETFNTGTTAALFDLTLNIQETDEKIYGSWHYNTDLFDADTMRRMSENFAALLESITTGPERLISELPLLASAERRRMLHDWNDTRRDYAADKCFHQLFEEQVERTPNAVAVSDDDEALSYSELNARANMLAHHLRRLGVQPEMRIGLLMERSVLMVTGLLGILKAGAAFVPIDPQHPVERISLMLEDSASPFVVTEEHLLEKLSHHAALIVCLDADEIETGPHNLENPPHDVTPENLAYLIYTSGSTGQPKGVLVEHRQLCNTMFAALENFNPGPADVMSCVASYTFDIFYFELMTTLLAGAQCLLVQSRDLLDPQRLTRALEKATCIQAVPALMRQILNNGKEHGRPRKYERIRQVFIGGEAVAPELLREMKRAFPHAQLNVLYGPTEATIFCGRYAVSNVEEVERQMIGAPLGNMRLYLCDAHGNLVPAGASGEICIGGASVARGYLNRPEATAEKFVPDSFSAEAGVRLYRSGDIGRRLPDGNIEFLRRIDEQVKVRGWRIEPGEIEAALVNHPSVRECVVIVREDRPGDQRLTAYLVTDEIAPPMNAGELRSLLKERLPEYMIPSAFVFLDQLPLTPNGKINRRALPVPDAERASLQGQFIAPRTSTEERLAAIFAQVLGLEEVGASDNFFELGGHSLLATQVISRISEAFQVDMPLDSIFESPTLEEMAGRIDALVGAGNYAKPSRLKRVERTEHLPLSYAQQRLWFIHQLDPTSPAYNIPLAVRLSGTLNINALEQTFSEIIRRHESLRTSFSLFNSQPAQLIHPPHPIHLPLTDLSHLDPHERETTAQRLAEAAAREPFDLAHGPLMRAALLLLSEAEHVLLVTMHHIVSDGWSMGVMVREVGALYESYSGGRESELPELEVQYGDYAVWQREYLQGEVLEQQVSYWRGQLGGAAEVLELPTDRPRPAVQSLRGAHLPFIISESLTAKLKELSQREGVTLFMTLLAGFKALLHRYTGQEDIIIGTPIAGRNFAETEDLIGFFINTLVLRTDFTGDPTFTELLERVREMALAAYMHQDVPFEKLVEELQPERDVSHSPLYQVMFELQNAPMGGLDLPGLTLSMMEADNQTAKFDLTLNLQETDEIIAGSLGYSTDLFEAETVRRLVHHFQVLLEDAAEHAHKHVSELELMSEDERLRLTFEWNDTRHDYPQDLLIHELFERQVEVGPDAVAVAFEGAEISYRELNQRADWLARRLQKSGVKPETLVGICLERSVEMVVALLGVLKAGGAFVSLDLTYPKERLAFLLADTQVRLLITQERLLENLPPYDGEIVFLEDPAASTEVEDEITARDSHREARAEQLAYVFYTSGSTGKPKGVLISHGGVVNYLTFIVTAYGLSNADTVLQLASLSFDASVRDILGPLIAGAKLVLVRDADARDPLALLAKMKEQRVTCLLSVVPTLLHALTKAGSNKSYAWETLRLILTSGENLLLSECAKAREVFGEKLTIVNQYGATECTMSQSYHAVPPTENEQGVALVGRPIANAQLYILDERLNPIPVGVSGEVYIGSVGIARGYLHSPALTAEKFIPNFFASETGARLYKTGDMARYRPGGQVELLGRIDSQVKIRGMRIELSEVEATLHAHEDVREVVVVAREVANDDKRLVAYVVAKREQPHMLRALRVFLKERLPEYMIPSAFVFLDQLPLTPNGKVDRNALPTPAPARPELEDAFAPPRTPVEEVLAGLWAEVLGVEQVGIKDNFFELGGHSLLATQVISRIREAFQIEIALRRLFETPTVAGLAQSVETAMKASQGVNAPPIKHVEKNAPLPLSYAQQRLWFIEQMRLSPALYNIPLAVRLSGTLNINALEQTFSEIIRRHESLRTSFSLFNSQPAQLIQPPHPIHLPLTDLSHLDPHERETTAQRLAEAAAREPFDLAHGPLMRAALLRLSAEQHVLLVTMHHIVSDGWSMGVMVREVGALYESYSGGRESELPELEVQYGDYAVWQREYLQGEVLEQQVSYWREQLGGAAEVLELPTDRPRPAVQTFRGAVEGFEIGAELGAQLKALSRGEGVTMFMLLLAAWQLLLSRYTGAEEVIVGTPIAGRNRAEVEHLIGFFVNALALRTDLSGDPTFTELLGRVREVALGGYLHQDVPFEKLVEELQPQRSLSYNPLFQVVFALENTPGGTLNLPGLQISGFDSETETAKFDLRLSLTELDQKLVGSLSYSTDLFDAATIQRMLSHFHVLLQSIAAHPEGRISELALLSEAEQKELLAGQAFVEKVERQAVCLHRLFEAQVERARDAIAVVFERERLTYGELNGRANQLAHRLHAMGVGPETLVGLYVERSLEMVVGILAILKAGGAYVPLDTQYPPDRLAFMINDAGLSLLLTQEHLLANLPECAAQILALDADGEMIARERPDNLFDETRADNLAYVIYTSGSTGRPKGVFVTHGNAARLFSETEDWFRFDARDVWTLFHSCAFDFSVWELWGALLYGGRLVIVPYLVSRSPEAFYELLVQQRVTILNQTPSAFRQLMIADETLGQGAELSLRFVIFGGEALELKSLKLWFERHGDRYPQLINMYGITETTVHVTYRPLSASDLDQTRGSLIGGPIPDLRVYVLDKHLRPVPDMMPGELYVGGEGVARGYLNRADLSAERFIPDALSGQRGVRLYRSGDLVRRLRGGEMEYLGRIDQQVKIRGYRIELGEIEVALGQHSSVRESVVIAREDVPGEKRLVCYLVLREGVASAPGADELREFLGGRLPDYMMPSAFVVLERIPLTAHGKVDRRALPAPTQARPALERSYIAPRDEMERALAAMWREILDIERIGINDNFFDLGGDSIRGAIFINRLQERLDQIVHVVVIFTQPTIAQLAEYLNQHYATAVQKLSGNDAHIAGAEDVRILPATDIDSNRLAEVRRLIQTTPMREEGRRTNDVEKKNPPAIFILSPPRSGTTLLRVMLAGHPRLFAPPELELLSFNTLRERSETFTGKDSFWLEGTLRAIMEIKNCGADEARRIMRLMEERGLTTKECYGQLQEWLGGRMLVDKTPSYALDRATLEKAERDFDNALYVHLIRHPSGMIRSFEEARLDQIFFRYEHSYSRRELAELIWIISHQNIIEFLDHVPPERQHRVKFEELLAQPQYVMESLSQFIGLTLHADMLQPYKDKERRMTDGLHAESRMLGDVKFRGYDEIVASVGAEWREHEERAPLSNITWEVAGLLGYEKETGEGALEASKTMAIRSLTKSGVTEFPLSYAQERLWFLDQMEQESSATYNIATAVRLHGALDVTALKQSLDEVYNRHSSLRTSFRTVDGEAVQIIAPSQSLNIQLIDLCDLTEAEREAEAQRLATEEARRPFNLAQGPMLRAALIKLSEDEQALLVTMHHIVSDGWSMGVLVREVTALYEAFSNGQASPLPELPVQYADYAVWQREYLQGEMLERELAYWRKQLAGAAQVLELPTDRPRPPVQSFRGATEPVIISAKVSESLKQLSRREGVTMFMLLLSAWQLLLSRYTGAEEVVVGTPIAGRNRAEVEHLIGFFVNTLVLRADLSGNPKFLDALRRVQEMVIGAFAHQDVPFEKLVEELQPERSLSHTPLFQVMFALQNAPAAEAELHGLRLSAVDVDAGTAKVDLALTLVETDDGIMGSLSYATDLFEARTIQRIAAHFKKLLDSIAAAPDLHLLDLALMSPIEERRILAECDETARVFDDYECLHRMFEAQVERTPETLALVFEDERLTYQELNARANQLAHHLRANGAGAETLVGILLERSVEMVVAMLAVLKSGAAYLPLDTEYPEQRLRLILEDARVPLLLTKRELLSKLSQLETRAICMDAERDLIELESASNLPGFSTTENLAYVIYTSGSTGVPKGVMIEHRGLCNLAEALGRDFNVGNESRVLQFSSFSFDVSVMDVATALTRGATLYLGTKESLLPGDNLLRALREHRITTVTLPPSALAVTQAEELQDLQTIISGGEVCGAELVKRWSPGRRFLNAYGPTEITVCATFQECSDWEKRPTIGRAIGGAEVYVLNEQQRPVPAGVVGEIYIGGVGVARGYLNRPELTAEKFIPHPFSRRAGARLYRTGDMARLLPGGEIDYQGRADEQVKVRGYRIELGEIESLIQQHPSVHEVLVLAREDAPGDKRLVAYVVGATHEESVMTGKLLRDYLKERLPEYMIPSAFVFLEELPLTPHGKYDRRALPAPHRAHTGFGDRLIAPRDSLELQLAQQWEELLNVPVGVTDDFFDLGGHSILAVRLVSRIERLYGKKLPLAALFRAPTVESLASLLRQEAGDLKWSPLVPIQPHGHARPFFCVHPVSGNVLCYRSLAQRLGADQPFYGLQARGLNDEQEPHARLEEMATDYLASMRAVQPVGPYLLGGWSIGGLIAFEMARQLEAQGEKVQLLVMIDTHAPVVEMSNDAEDDEASLLASFAIHTGLSAEQLQAAADDISQVSPEDYLSYLLEQSKSLSLIPHDVSLTQLRQQFRIFKTNVRAARSYQPPNHPASNSIVLFRAEERAEGARELDLSLGWSRQGIENLETHEIPGNHLTMVREPFVSVLAEKLSARISQSKTPKP